jgi:TRAP-type C4-dicarboxylate transport system substrate-binding protein
MHPRTLVISLLGALALGLPGSSHLAGAEEGQYLRIATLAPRDSDLAKGFMKLDQGMKKATNGAWGVRLYPSGVAGDETDVLRKMKVGQMDASIITSVGLSQIVRETTLLNVPGVIRDYKGLEAVQAAMSKEWEANFDKAGYRLVAWGETGQLRWFAKQPLTRPSSVKNMRPWVWPSAHAMKESLLAVGANGVPLGVPEVYGALQTGMIDMVTSTCVALVSLQWHSTLKYMTKDTSGILVGAMLMSGTKWKALPPDVQGIVLGEINRTQAEDKQDIRKADERSYQMLLKRGFTANEWTGDALKEAETMMDTVQKRLVGRMYTAEQLATVKKLAGSK